MAPSDRNDHSEEEAEKADVFALVKKQAKIPDSFVSLTDAKRQYELNVEVIFKKSNY